MKSVEKEKERRKKASKAYRERHKELGLCVECSNKSAPGFTKCNLHRNKDRSDSKTLYDFYKLHGISMKSIWRAQRT